MAPRPISGWAYTGSGDASGWASLDGRFGAPVESATGIPDALCAARRRWGLSRVVSITAGTSWVLTRPQDQVGFGYTKLGPDADSGVLRSAWGLLERGVADAVWVRAQGGEFVLERTGVAPVTLHPGGGSPAEFALEVSPGSMITAVVIGAAIAELGLPCGPGGDEPERICVRTALGTWQVEVRP